MGVGKENEQHPKVQAWSTHRTWRKHLLTENLERTNMQTLARGLSLVLPWLEWNHFQEMRQNLSYRSIQGSASQRR